MTAMSRATDKITDYRPIGAGIFLYMLAPLGMTLIPLVVGAAATDLGFSDSEVGYLASADLAGLAVVSASAAFWIRKLSWHLVAGAALAVIILGNLLSVAADSFTSLCVARFITEMGSGAIFSLALVTLGETKTPDRFYSFGIGMTIALSVGVFVWFPSLIAIYGIDTIFIFHGVVAAIVIPGIFWLPKAVGIASQSGSGAQLKDYVPLFLCFIGFGCFMVAEGGIWSYIERIGAGSGLDADYVGQVLAATQVASLAATMLSSYISIRFGRVWPIGLGMFGFLISLYLVQIPTADGYLIGACLSQFAWVFVLPYLLLLCVELDPSGRFYVLTTAFKMSGFALGPAIVATLIHTGGQAQDAVQTVTQDFSVVSWVGTIFLSLSLVLLLPLARRLDRRVSS